MPQRRLRFDLYSLHAHLDGRPVDYRSLFHTVARSLAGHTERDGSRRIAIDKSDILEDGKVFVIAYTGYLDRTDLYYDLERRAEHTETTSPTRFRARKTHIMIAPDQRLAAVEAKKGNLSTSDFETIIEAVARSASLSYRPLELTFNPVADVDFIREIDGLRRIQSATVVIGEPNFNWTDWNNRLAEVAEDSNARSLGVSASARRDKSLSKDSGLIQFVKEFAGHARSIFKRVSIIGARTEDSGLTTLNLNKYIEHHNISVDVDPETEQPDEEEVREKLDSYMNSRPAA